MSECIDFVVFDGQRRGRNKFIVSYETRYSRHARALANFCHVIRYLAFIKYSDA